MNNERRKRSLTLIEFIITFLLLSVFMGVIVYMFRTVLVSWAGIEQRTGVDITLDWAVEEVSRDIRRAKAVQSTAGLDELRFTQINNLSYIYYFYNENDSYPQSFSQDYYQLRKVDLSGGINGNFTYGEGKIVLYDVIPPSVSDLSISQNIVTLDFSVRRYDELVRSRTQIKPRNLL
jgi:predicted membrane protein